MRRALTCFLAACTMVGPTRADYYLVVQASNTQTSMTQKEAVDLFMSRRHVFRNGDAALVFDLARGHSEREGFYKSLTGLSLAQVNSYWSRLMFSGESRPPQELADEAAMLDMVKRNPNALAWVPHEPTDKQVRTLLVLKEPN